MSGFRVAEAANYADGHVPPLPVERSGTDGVHDPVDDKSVPIAANADDLGRVGSGQP